MLNVIDFWFDMGVDGDAPGRRALSVRARRDELREFARDACVPQRDARPRGQKVPNRMLLAEANQWPEDAVAYFGEGDECHMAFHFPVMPRHVHGDAHGGSLSRSSTSCEQTPAIPENCQWAMFLRNHDELTLEMVTDEERDYMYRAYAQDRADAHQPRHPPPACAAAGKGSASRSS